MAPFEFGPPFPDADRLSVFADRVGSSTTTRMAFVADYTVAP